jgi:hypothetical protein
MAKWLVIHDPAFRECVLRRAKKIARGHNSVEVWTADGVHVATATPDGHIDATWEGSRYVSIVPTTDCDCPNGWEKQCVLAACNRRR